MPSDEPVTTISTNPLEVGGIRSPKLTLWLTFEFLKADDDDVDSGVEDLSDQLVWSPNPFRDVLCIQLNLSRETTRSLASSILQFREENGRTYHKYKDGSWSSLYRSHHLAIG